MAVNQLNLPAIYGAAEQVKGQRAQNQLYQIQTELAQKNLDQVGKPTREQQFANLKEFRLVVDWAKTPEQWGQAVDFLNRTTNSTEFNRFRFEDRDAISAGIDRDIAEYGRPQAGIGPGGKPAFFQTTNKGDVRKVPDFTPAPKTPGVSVNIGPQGIDYGPPPKGMAWARDPSGKVALEKDPNSDYSRPVAIPVAGGPVETKRTKVEEAAEVKRRLELAKVDLVVEDIDRAISMTKSAKVPVTGFGSYLSAVPGTRAHDVSALVTTIKANIGFDRLQQMRESSPTGGALGAVSEREMDQLSSVLGNLEQSQTEEMFLFNLNRVREMVLDMVHGPGNRPGKDAQAGQGSPAGQPEETKTVGGKTYVKHGGKWFEQ